MGENCLADNTTGDDNIAIGMDALRVNTTASDSVAVGTNALKANTAALNVAVGKDALLANTSGSQNTAVGTFAGNSITTGDNNSSFGKDAGEIITTGSNNISIGYNANPSGATESNEITLGNTSNDDLRCNDTSISGLSDSRDKVDVVDLPAGLSFLNTLRPVKFKWQTRDGNIKDGRIRAGFLAQELQTAQKDNEFLNLVSNKNPDRLEAKYGNLIPVLVQAVKELSAKVTALEAK